MKKTLTTIFLCAAVSLWFAGCKDDNPASEPMAELLVSPATLSASAAAGEYTLAVTGNVEWSAVANAEWITIAPAEGTGTGTLVVNVGENPSAETRTATVNFTAGTLSNAAIIMQEARPFYAASTRTWVIGGQTWSDVIEIPECNKEDYLIDNFYPQCRAYTDALGTTYFYNWPYVNLRSYVLCPSPWRVPTNMDFMTLDMALGGTAENRVIEDVAWVGTQYVNIWGGAYNGVLMNNQDPPFTRGTAAFYWSAKANSGLTAYCSVFSSTGLVYPQASQLKEFGQAIRCIKD